MALIKCPECGKEVSDTANSCPECGYNFQKQKVKNRAKKLIVILLPAIVIVTIIVAIIVSMNVYKGNPFENITMSTTKEDLSAIYGLTDKNGVWDNVIFCGLEGQMMLSDLKTSIGVNWWYEFDEPLSNSEIEKQYGKYLKRMKKEAKKLMPGETKEKGNITWYYSDDGKSYIYVSSNKRMITVAFGPKIG